MSAFWLAALVLAIVALRRPRAGVKEPSTP